MTCVAGPEFGAGSMVCVVVSVPSEIQQRAAVRVGFGAKEVDRHVGDYLTSMDSNALDTLFRVGESSTRT